MITSKEAWKLLKEYNKEDFHLKHARTVALCMKEFANMKGYLEESELWEISGMLHDIDYEMYPSLHCKKAEEILTEKNLDPKIIHAVISHGYGICYNIKPETEMEKILYAIDELTGLMGAAALMRPSKSFQDMNLKSIRKKFKDKSFAAGCNREIIEAGAELLDMEIMTLLDETLEVMKKCEDDINDEEYYEK